MVLFCLNVHNDHWRETPLFRQWRKYLQVSLARGWRKRYRWFRSPVAYSKARTIAGIRYKQTEPVDGEALRALATTLVAQADKLELQRPSGNT